MKYNKEVIHVIGPNLRLTVQKGRSEEVGDRSSGGKEFLILDFEFWIKFYFHFEIKRTF